MDRSIISYIHSIIRISPPSSQLSGQGRLRDRTVRDPAGEWYPQSWMAFLSLTWRPVWSLCPVSSQLASRGRKEGEAYRSLPTAMASNRCPLRCRIQIVRSTRGRWYDVYLVIPKTWLHGNVAHTSPQRSAFIALRNLVWPIDRADLAERRPVPPRPASPHLAHVVWIIAVSAQQSESCPTPLGPLAFSKCFWMKISFKWMNLVDMVLPASKRPWGNSSRLIWSTG